MPNVWYMLAMCLLGGGQTEAAAEALQHGRKLLKKQADAEELAKDFSDLKVRAALNDIRHAFGPNVADCHSMQYNMFRLPFQ